MCNFLLEFYNFLLFKFTFVSDLRLWSNFFFFRFLLLLCSSIRVLLLSIFFLVWFVWLPTNRITVCPCVKHELRVVRVANELISSQSNWLCHLQRFAVAINLKLNRTFSTVESIVFVVCLLVPFLFSSIFVVMARKLQLMIEVEIKNIKSLSIR